MSFWIVVRLQSVVRKQVRMPSTNVHLLWIPANYVGQNISAEIFNCLGADVASCSFLFGYVTFASKVAGEAHTTFPRRSSLRGVRSLRSFEFKLLFLGI